MKRRGSGVLLHITSLPSSYGMGDLGPWAYRFADFLAESRQLYWQVLPLNPTCTVYGNSPYSSYSAFAGNPLLISPDLLLRDGLVAQVDLDESPTFSNESVQYQAVAQYKTALLDRAYRGYRDRLVSDADFKKFCHDNAEWLEDYALFQAFKARFNRIVWRDWPADVRDRKEVAVRSWSEALREEILREKFVQFLFFRQWTALKRYCNSKSILIIGDLPIYVNYDSADVWSNPQIFKLDERRHPTVVAGVPPDYFSVTGQLWGNPVYNWEALQGAGYSWWVRRMKHNLGFFDEVRMDHFRGFVACWEVPAGETTAMNGVWMNAPAQDFFATLLKQLPSLPILAEDLGVITPDVREVMDRFGFPGMRVLVFAFGSNTATHPYVPHNYTRNCAVYTGTHDNNTVKGWFRGEASPDERKRLLAYIGREVPEDQVHWELIRLALMSVAETAIVPMQDLLGLGEEARMNRPATTEGNWEWRLLSEQLTPALAAKLGEITELYGRAPE